MNNKSLQFHTIDPSPRFKCITMWRIIHQTGCTKTEAFERMGIKRSERPFAGCFACESSGPDCKFCPIIWGTKDGLCPDYNDDPDIAITILDACASWVPDVTDEVFLPIKGYKNIYEASNFGRVKSLARYNSRGHMLQERILKYCIRSGEVATVHLFDQGVGKTYDVHSLVWQAHIETHQGYNHQNLNYARIRFRNGKSPVLHNLYRVVGSANLHTV